MWEDDGSSDGEDTPWTLRDLSSVGGFTLTVNGTAEEADEVGDDELAAQGVYLSDTSSESQAEANVDAHVVAPFVSDNMFVNQSPQARVAHLILSRRSPQRRLLVRPSPPPKLALAQRQMNRAWRPSWSPPRMFTSPSQFPSCLSHQSPP